MIIINNNDTSERIMILVREEIHKSEAELLDKGVEEGEEEERLWYGLTSESLTENELLLKLILPLELLMLPALLLALLVPLLLLVVEVDDGGAAVDDADI